MLGEIKLHEPLGLLIVVQPFFCMCVYVFLIRILFLFFAEIKPI